VPFVVFRDGEGRQEIVALPAERDQLSIGRDGACDISLVWDDRVSRLHARLEHGGGSWTVYDSGFSTNGTFLNAERVQGHRVLNDGDHLRFGRTEVEFHDPSPQRSRTVVSSDQALPPLLSPAQKRVLIALCRPYKNHSAFARPASNREIASELVLSVDAVKTHLRALFAKFALDDLPQNEKRMRLAERSLRSGVVRETEL
jgi:DNA-binding CsgD family transcriptional regulator